MTINFASRDVPLLARVYACRRVYTRVRSLSVRLRFLFLSFLFLLFVGEHDSMRCSLVSNAFLSSVSFPSSSFLRQNFFLPTLLLFLHLLLCSSPQRQGPAPCRATRTCSGWRERKTCSATTLSGRLSVPRLPRHFVSRPSYGLSRPRAATKIDRVARDGPFLGGQARRRVCAPAARVDAGLLSLTPWGPFTSLVLSRCDALNRSKPWDRARRLFLFHSLCSSLDSSHCRTSCQNTHTHPPRVRARAHARAYALTDTRHRHTR